MAAVDVQLANYKALILVFGQSGCPACEEYLPTFRRVAARHNTIPAFAVDSSKQDTASDKFLITVTPTTILISNGKTVKRFEGQGSAADVEKLFQFAESLP